MKRCELEHIIRAAKGITDQKEIVVVGSQSILGQFPDPAPELLISMEADVFPLHNPGLSDAIDGAIGERSMFHQTHGHIWLWFLFARFDLRLFISPHRWPRLWDQFPPRLFRRFHAHRDLHRCVT